MAYEQRLVEAARSLARIDKRKPRRANLSRAASTAYYALFHCLAQNCADMLVGGSYSSRTTRAWNQAYRALQHGNTRNRCRNKEIIREFPQDIQEFAKIFCEMQAQRNQADYDPRFVPYRSEVTGDINRVQMCIDRFGKVSIKDRRAFAVYVLLPLRG